MTWAAESSEFRVVLLLFWLLLPPECGEDDPTSAGRRNDAPDAPDAADFNGEPWQFHARSLTIRIHKFRIFLGIPDSGDICLRNLVVYNFDAAFLRVEAAVGTRITAAGGVQIDVCSAAASAGAFGAYNRNSRIDVGGVVEPLDGEDQLASAAGTHQIFFQLTCNSNSFLLITELLIHYYKY